MFDRLDDMLRHYEELMLELNNPSVAEDQRRFRKLMKEQADLAPIVDAYKQYKQAKQDVEDSLALLDEESDEEMKELAKEELADAKKRIEELEPEVRDHEPRGALDGTADGLYFYRILAEECGKHLTPGGHVYFEIGYDQGAAVKELLDAHGFQDTKVIKDLPGKDLSLIHI